MKAKQNVAQRDLFGRYKLAGQRPQIDPFQQCRSILQYNVHIANGDAHLGVTQEQLSNDIKS